MQISILEITKELICTLIVKDINVFKAAVLELWIIEFCHIQFEYTL
jgi:hypothetical protein